MTPGIFICDLGGSINRVLTVNGSASKFGEKADALNFATNEKKQSSFTGFYNLWFLNNGTTQTNYAKVRVVFSVCSTYSGSEERNLTISVVKEGGGAYDNTTASKALNDFGGSDWDGTQWGVYECICSGLQAHASIKIAAPNGGIGTQFALLIKSVEFIALDGASDADVKAASIAIEEREVDINADHTTIACPEEVNLRKVDVSSSKIPVEGTTSSDRYPTYYEEINALEIPFTIIPDINKVAEGKSITANLDIIGGGSTLHKGLTVTVPATSGAPVTCNFENILYRNNYNVQLNSVQYSTTTDGETTSEDAITKDIKTKQFQNNITRPNVSFTNSDNPILYKNSNNYSAIFQDTFQDPACSNLAGYVTYSISQADNNLDAGILTEGFSLCGNNYGVTGYEHRASSDDFDFAKHNWSKIIYESENGNIVLHVANIIAEKEITRSYIVLYPLYNNPIAYYGEYGINANEITNKIATLNPKATSEKFTYTPSSTAIAEIEQTSVANVAVDASGKVEFYNLQGVKVAEDALTPGIYVRRAAGKAVKVIVK
jgi:hypothetical protein